MNAKTVLLVAVDFSEPSNRALDAAIGLAKQLGARLHLVHALELPTPVFSTYAFQIPETFLDSARGEARRLLEKSLKRAAKSGIDAEYHLASHPASLAIAEVGERIGADLIVMGTHGHAGLKHLALGSVAERTLRHAKCSVLVVKPKTGEETEQEKRSERSS